MHISFHAFFFYLQVITEILRYLTVSDRKQAGLVNHAWYDASLDPILQSDVVFTFHPDIASNRNIPSLGSRRVCNISIGNAGCFFNTTDMMSQSVGKIAKTLKCLSLKGSTISERTLFNLLTRCHVLEHVDLSCCNSLFLSGNLFVNEADQLRKKLHTVKELNLSSISHITDITFQNITSIFVNLEKMALAGNHMFFKMPNSSYANAGPSRAVFTFDAVLDFLQERGSKIKSLNLSRSLITDSHLQTLASVAGLNLREMIMICCRNISDRGVSYFVLKQRHLEVMDLSQCQELTGETLNAITHNLQDIRSLQMEKIRRITDSSVKNLNKLRYLEQLNLSACHSLTNRGLLSIFCDDNQLKHLTWLNVSYCTLVQDDLVKRICITAPQLKHLEISSCNKITNISIHFISHYLNHLRSLRLAWCKNITDDGLYSFGVPRKQILLPPEECRCQHKQMVPKLLNLPSVLDKTCSTDFDEATSDINVIPLSNLRMLKELDLTACHRITDDSLTQMLKFVQLQILHLTMCSSITDQTLFAIAANCPCVEQLYLSQCTNITNTGIIMILQHLKRLKLLDISGCDLLTDECLFAMSEYSKGLQQLDVSMCSGLTLHNVDELELNLTHLHTVNKRLLVDNSVYTCN